MLRSWRGVTRRYLDDVIKSGGLEGKFAQNVYPYAHIEGLGRLEERRFSPVLGRRAGVSAEGRGAGW